MRNLIKELFRRNGGVFACFYVLAQLDVYLFVGFPETVKQVIGTTLLAASIALLCLAIPVFFVRFRRQVAFIEMFILAIFEVVELIAKVCFDTGLNGDWILLVLGTSWQEVKDCLMTCSIPVVMLAVGGLILPPPRENENFLSPQFRCRENRIVDEGNMSYDHGLGR